MKYDRVCWIKKVGTGGRAWNGKFRGCVQAGTWIFSVPMTSLQPIHQPGLGFLRAAEPLLVSSSPPDTICMPITGADP